MEPVLVVIDYKDRWMLPRAGRFRETWAQYHSDIGVYYDT